MIFKNILEKPPRTLSMQNSSQKRKECVTFLSALDLDLTRATSRLLKRTEPTTSRKKKKGPLPVETPMDCGDQLQMDVAWNLASCHPPN
jgi:hypothetical protein